MPSAPKSANTIRPTFTTNLCLASNGPNQVQTPRMQAHQSGPDQTLRLHSLLPPCSTTGQRPRPPDCLPTPQHHIQTRSYCHHSTTTKPKPQNPNPDNKRNDPQRRSAEIQKETEQKTKRKSRATTHRHRLPSSTTTANRRRGTTAVRPNCPSSPAATKGSIHIPAVLRLRKNPSGLHRTKPIWPLGSEPAIPEVYTGDWVKEVNGGREEGAEVNRGEEHRGRGIG